MSTTPQDTAEYLQIDDHVLDLGYKNCKASAKHFFGPYLWMISNMTGHHRRGMDALLAHLARVSGFLDLLSADGLPLETWANYRSEVSRALAGQCRKSELAALADTVNRFQIPRQFIFDPMNAGRHEDSKQRVCNCRTVQRIYLATWWVPNGGVYAGLRN